MSGEMLMWVSIGLTVAVLAVVWLRTRPANVGEAINQMQEAAEFARIAVQAAEQLWKSGSLSADARLDYAMDLIVAEFPGLDKDRARMTIEAAVYWLKHLRPMLMAVDGGAK